MGAGLLWLVESRASLRGAESPDTGGRALWRSAVGARRAATRVGDRICRTSRMVCQRTTDAARVAEGSPDQSRAIRAGAARRCTLIFCTSCLKPIDTFRKRAKRELPSSAERQRALRARAAMLARFVLTSRMIGDTLGSVTPTTIT